MILGIAMGLSLAEAAARLIPSRFRENLERHRYIFSRNIMHMQFCEPDPDPLISWRNIPGKEGIFENKEFRTHLRFNSYGMRGPEISAEPDSRRRRIFMLGDSYVVGWGVEEQETFVARLNAQRPDWEVLNLGVSGYGTRDEWGLLKRLGPVLKPVEVVVFFYHNDPEESYVHFMLPTGPALRRRRWPELYLPALVREFGKGERRKKEPPYYFKTDPRFESAAALNLHKIDQWCRAHDVALKIVYLPSKDELGEKTPVGYRRGLLDFCRKERLRCLDATPYFQRLSKPQSAYYPLDDHLNPSGHKLVARFLLDSTDG